MSRLSEVIRHMVEVADAAEWEEELAELLDNVGLFLRNLRAAPVQLELRLDGVELVSSRLSGGEWRLELSDDDAAWRRMSAPFRLFYLQTDVRLDVSPASVQNVMDRIKPLIRDLALICIEEDMCLTMVRGRRRLISVGRGVQSNLGGMFGRAALDFAAISGFIKLLIQG
ncbi:hypothetical protein JW905_14750 [bacterium]|nr:hypothetical protein [candidate division CSSED10-310 bacterium]